MMCTVRSEHETVMLTEDALVYLLYTSGYCFTLSVSCDLHHGLFSPDFCLKPFFFPPNPPPSCVSAAAGPTHGQWREGCGVRLGLGLSGGDEQQRGQHAGPDPSGRSGHPHPPLPWEPSGPRPQQGQCPHHTSRYKL